MQLLKPHLAAKSHVIWDWNGTLLSDVQLAVDSVNRLLAEERLGQLDVESYKKVFGFPVIEYYRRLGFDTSPGKFTELCERFNEHFHAGLHTCDLWPGARDILGEVKAQGKTQSLLSASEHNLLLRSIGMFDLAHLFDEIVGISDKTAGSKVDQGRNLLERTASPRDQTILIGDTDHDLEVAQALGIDVILVEHGHQCPTRLRDIHHCVLKVL
ncbi:MAG: HAD family hydrolase [Bdellovibrionales bacterium]